jgi:uncharacterized metal-binding protein
MASGNPKAKKNPRVGKYQDPGCAYCPPSVRACRRSESDSAGPGYCPSRVDEEGIEEARNRYTDPAVRRIAQESARVESEGYCRWSRVEEICQFAKRMGFTKVGIASCISFLDEAYVLSQILESHGFDVASTACKHGGIPKEDIGLKDAEKIRPGTHESMCNPVSQAGLLNRAGCELNVVLGLCVGHDSLFCKRCDGLVTTLVTKDRVLAHNPIGALHLAESYYRKVWGPQRPEKPPKLPKRGRPKPAGEKSRS